MLVILSSMSVPICNHFHVTRANNGRITLLRGCPSFSLSSVGIPFTQWHEILSQNTRDSKLSYGGNQKSLSQSGLRSVPGCDRHQDRITIANTLALARKNEITLIWDKFGPVWSTLLQLQVAEKR